MKTQTMSILIAGFLLLLVHTNLAYSETNSSAPTPACIQQMIAEGYAIGSSVDKTKAISLAESSDEYKSKIQGYTASSPNVSEEWTLNSVSCSVTLKEVHVAFFLNDSRGNAKTMQVALDPSLTTILSLVVHDSVWYGQGPNGTTATPEFPTGVVALLISISFLILISSRSRLKF